MERTGFIKFGFGTDVLSKLFQNLIRKKIMRIDDEQIFKKIEFHDKYSLIDRNRAK